MNQIYQKTAACKEKLKSSLLSVLRTPTGKLSVKKINIADTVLRYSLRYPFNNLSQNRIAKESGSGKTLVYEVMAELEKFFFKQERRFKNNREISSRYYLNPIFRTKQMLKELAEYLPSLRRIPSLWIETFALSLLLSGHPSVAFLDQYYQDFDNRELNRYINKDFKYRKTIYGDNRNTPNAMPIGSILQELLKKGDLRMKPITTDTESQPQYHSKHPQQESSKPVSPYRTMVAPSKANQLVNYARDYWDQYKAGKRSKFWVRANLADKKKCYPEGIEAFKKWITTDQVGRAFMAEIWGAD